MTRLPLFDHTLGDARQARVGAWRVAVLERVGGARPARAAARGAAAWSEWRLASATAGYHQLLGLHLEGLRSPCTWKAWGGPPHS